MSRSVAWIFAVLGLAMLVSCNPFQPQKGCTDSSALNFNALADEDDGSCSYSRVVFYGGVNPLFVGLPVTVLVDGASVGQIDGVYPGGEPGNCTADFTAKTVLKDGRSHDWNARATNGRSFSGTIQAQRGQECIKVRVF